MQIVTGLESGTFTFRVFVAYHKLRAQNHRTEIAFKKHWSVSEAHKNI